MAKRDGSWGAITQALIEAKIGQFWQGLNVMLAKVFLHLFSERKAAFLTSRNVPLFKAPGRFVFVCRFFHRLANCGEERRDDNKGRDEQEGEKGACDVIGEAEEKAGEGRVFHGHCGEGLLDYLPAEGITFAVRVRGVFPAALHAIAIFTDFFSLLGSGEELVGLSGGDFKLAGDFASRHHFVFSEAGQEGIKRGVASRFRGDHMAAKG